MIAIAYSGMMTMKPAMIRVDTRYEMDLMPITSSASISSLMRMAPSSAVAPAPTVAAKPTPATTGAAMRTLISAAKNPVNASPPTMPSQPKPCVTTTHATCPLLPNPRAGAETRPVPRSNARGNRERRTWVVATSAPRSEPDTDRGQHHIDGEQGDHAKHQRLVDRGAHALGAAGNGQAAVTAHQAGDQAECSSLDHRDDHLGQPGDQRQRRDVRAGGHVLQVYAEDVSAHQANADDRTVEQHRHERRR